MSIPSRGNEHVQGLRQMCWKNHEESIWLEQNKRDQYEDKGMMGGKPTHVGPGSVSKDFSLY